MIMSILKIVCFVGVEILASVEIRADVLFVGVGVEIRADIPCVGVGVPCVLISPFSCESSSWRSTHVEQRKDPSSSSQTSHRTFISSNLVI